MRKEVGVCCLRPRRLTVGEGAMEVSSRLLLRRGEEKFVALGCLVRQREEGVGGSHWEEEENIKGD